MKVRWRLHLVALVAHAVLLIGVDLGEGAQGDRRQCALGPPNGMHALCTYMIERWLSGSASRQRPPPCKDWSRRPRQAETPHDNRDFHPQVRCIDLGRAAPVTTCLCTPLSYLHDDLLSRALKASLQARHG